MPRMRDAFLVHGRKSGSEIAPPRFEPMVKVNERLAGSNGIYSLPATESGIVCASTVLLVDSRPAGACVWFFRFASFLRL